MAIKLFSIKANQITFMIKYLMCEDKYLLKNIILNMKVILHYFEKRVDK
jgi:hypothetical protein